MARTRLLFLHHCQSFLKNCRLQVRRLQVISPTYLSLNNFRLKRTWSFKSFHFKPITGRRKKVKVLFLLLFLFSFVLTQGLTWFFSGGILPVFATNPAVTTVVQNSANPKTLVQQGKVLYERGKFAEAVTLSENPSSPLPIAPNPLQGPRVPHSLFSS